ncbi:MAG: DNA polymerase IV [Acidobacteria bacterium]|nr:DNA polymerase IV [Acidobacteriota bacterium]
MDRRILHIDMDAFYASVEQRDDASLRGKPVAVGGPPDQRGVVAAASYEARIFGVHSAMPMATAVRLCPALVIVAPDFQKYRTVSKVIFDIFRSVTPLVEPLSMDEAYLDVTKNAWGEALGVTVAKRIKQEIRDRTELTASAGVAPNKFLAKIASGWKKPNGLTVIAPDRIESFLQELPIDAFWGVGPKTARKLRALGLQKVVDVRAVDLELLRGAVGSLAEWLKRLADGHDDRAVEPDRPAKSASTENTYATDIRDLQTIRAEIAEMAQHSARWLERTQRLCRTVTIKVRYGNFTTITRSHSTKVQTRSADELVRRALHLLDRTEAGRLPVRLLGVGVTGLTEEGESGTMDKLF